MKYHSSLLFGCWSVAAVAIALPTGVFFCRLRLGGVERRDCSTLFFHDMTRRGTCYGTWCTWYDTVLTGKIQMSPTRKIVFDLPRNLAARSVLLYSLSLSLSLSVPLSMIIIGLRKSFGDDDSLVLLFTLNKARWSSSG